MNSHLHEIADVIETGEFPRASNLQAEVIEKGGALVFTHRIISGKAGRSYAEEVATSMGITTKTVDEIFKKRVKKGELPPDLK